MDSSTTPILLVALVVIAALVAWLVTLLRRLSRQQESARLAETQLAASNQTRHEERVRSMELISIAALAGDCDLSEACIRVHHLLQFYPGLARDERFLAITEMYEELRDFATHDARAALPAAERLRQDRARSEIEARYRLEMLASLGVLRERMKALQGSAFDIDLATGADLAAGAAATARPSAAGLAARAP